MLCTPLDREGSYLVANAWAQHAFPGDRWRMAAFVNNLAEESGIRLATLQYYYKTKQQLFQAAFEDTLAQEREQINRMVVRAGNSLESILRARTSGHYKANLHDETCGLLLPALGAGQTGRVRRRTDG